MINRFTIAQNGVIWIASSLEMAVSRRNYKPEEWNTAGNESQNPSDVLLGEACSARKPRNLSENTALVAANESLNV
jgi:hypothetical protein